MRKGFYTASLLMLVWLCFTGNEKAYATLNYEVYLESWDGSYNSPPSWQTALQNLPAVPGSSPNSSYQGTVVNIAFGAYVFPGLQGLQFMDTNSDVASIIQFVHGQQGKVKISFGGASYSPPFYPNYFISQTTSNGGWPNNISYLASEVVAVLNTNFGTNPTPLYFDGLDFDVEDAQPQTIQGQPYSAQQFSDDLMAFFTAIKASPSYPIGKPISLTIPGQGWNTYWEILAKAAAAPGSPVDYISFMEYDIYITPGISMAQQIGADLLTYTSNPSESLPPNWTPGWGLDPAKVQVGLMPANDDNGNYLSVQAAAGLASLAALNKYGKPLYGVMLWDLDRDALTDLNPNTASNPTKLTSPPYQYSNAIRAALASPTPLSNIHPIQKKRWNRTLVPFIRQPVPPHGNPI